MRTIITCTLAILAASPALAQSTDLWGRSGETNLWGQPVEQGTGERQITVRPRVDPQTGQWTPEQTYRCTTNSGTGETVCR